MSTIPTRTSKLEQLNKKQVHAMALENLKQHLELKGSGEKSSPDKVLDVLLAAATNNKGSQKVAVDLVEVPYHGLAAKDSNEIRRGQAKQGTTHFHVFATAYVVRQHRRVTLALHYVRQAESLVSVLDALKSWLSGSRVLFASTQSYWDRHTIHSETDGTLTFNVAVVRRYSKPSRRGKQVPPTTLVYAVVGKRLQPQRTKRSFYSVVETYRSRFGIESSYRQMNQARLRTCSRSPELRLSLFCHFGEI